MKSSRIHIAAKDVHSLVWCGNKLIDWTGGIQAFHLDGRHEPRQVGWGYKFDSACATPDGRYAVLYRRLGTKGLLLLDGKIVRELNRSYYHAEVYEYPVCIWKTQSGRTLITHCPEDYCRIEIEDAETGERLTHGERKPGDFFHSRLMVNSAGTRLLSAGWFWHPIDSLVYFEIDDALRDGKHLDSLDSFPPNPGDLLVAEVGSACWQIRDRLLLGGVAHADAECEVEVRPGELRLHPRGIAVYDVASRRYVKSFELDQAPGTMMPIGETHVLCFYKHPKLVSLETGEVIERWDDLNTGDQASSIVEGAKLPPLALDVENRRFAVAGPDGITVIQIDLED